MLIPPLPTHEEIVALLAQTEAALAAMAAPVRDMQARALSPSLLPWSLALKRVAVGLEQTTAGLKMLQDKAEQYRPKG